ncbi:hypothetical protein OS493_022007 [Desmophyllum pertusum]|uniref:Death domain-containing protein n=1 Tax=Desmophyllum pertusum TaxID=174260 RepID=A0A9X0CQG7_9CNID|nr:hypothetical protein OS493_022007 [Desmophyllum pertusum]
MERNPSHNGDEDAGRRAVVTATHVLEICQDVGSCWHDLGITLKLSPAALHNVDNDYRLCREKAREMLYTWMEMKGNAATVGILADALEDIRKKSIAQKLLGVQQTSRDQIQRDEQQNSRSRTDENRFQRNDDGSHGNAGGVHYGNITFNAGPDSNVTFFGGNNQRSTVRGTKKE